MFIPILKLICQDLSAIYDVFFRSFKDLNSITLRAIPFSKAHWGEYLPPQFNFVDPLPVHFKFIITLRTTLCHPLLPQFELFNTPIPALRIIFRSFPSWVTC